GRADPTRVRAWAGCAQLPGRRRSGRGHRAVLPHPLRRPRARAGRAGRARAEAGPDWRHTLVSVTNCRERTTGPRRTVDLTWQIIVFRVCSGRPWACIEGP